MCSSDLSTIGFDDTMDAILKESGSETGFEFSTVSEEGDNLVINTLPELVLGDEVGLYTFTGTAEEYVISLSQFEDIVSFDKVILYDSKTGVYQDLRVDNYVFTGDPDYGKDRFKMYLGEVATSVGDFGLSVQTCFAYAESGNVSVRFVNDLVTARQVNVYNSLGQLIDNGVIQQGDREITLGSKGVLSGGVLIIDVEGEAPTRVIMQ